MDESEHRERLETLRDQLAEALQSASENMLPQLAGQYRQTLDALASLGEVKQQASVQDELRDRRKKRRQKSA